MFFHFPLPFDGHAYICVFVYANIYQACLKKLFVKVKVEFWQ